MKDFFSNKKNRNISILIIILFLIIITICLFGGNKNKGESTVLSFLDYDVPYDGEVELANYKRYKIDINKLFDKRWEIFLEDLKEDYKEVGGPIKNGIVKEDSIINISYTMQDEKGNIVVALSNCNINLKENFLGKVFDDNLKNGFLGKTDGEKISFEIKADDVLYLGGIAEGVLKVDATLNNLCEDYIYRTLDDEFFLEVFGMKKDEYKEYFEELLANELYSSYENYEYYIQDFIGEKLYDECKIIKEATGSKNAYNETVDYLVSLMAAKSNMSVEEYASIAYGKTLDELYDYYSTNRGGYDTILIEIALKEGIDISDEAFNEYLLKYANQLGFKDIEEVKKAENYEYSEATNKQEFVEDQVLRYLKDNYIKVIQWDGLDDSIEDVEEYLINQDKQAEEEIKKEQELLEIMNQAPVLNLNDIKETSNK